MAITPNYSWPLPDDTSLVKDGAEAIRDLGNAIDTTVDGLGSGGLVHIKSEAFSATAGVNVNDCFTTNFTHYIISISANTTVAINDLNLRLRDSGVDVSSSVYQSQRLFQSGASVTSDRITLTFFNGFGTGFSGLTGTLNLFYPANVQATQMINNFIGADANAFGFQSYGRTTVTTAFDGFSLTLSGAGTMTGRVDVFGYARP